jgi:hypothetical protein
MVEELNVPYAIVRDWARYNRRMSTTPFLAV